MDTKICNLCNTEKPLVDMTTIIKDGITYWRNKCKKCHTQERYKWTKDNPDKSKAQSVRHNARQRLRRKSLDGTDGFIYQDSRKSDKRHNRVNDLTRDFIRDAIKDGCRYCGETTIRMTMDRIDNDKGHTMDNVVPACIRCNYTRKDMPYEAWLVVAKGMKEAHENGLFLGWTGRVQ